MCYDGEVIVVDRRKYGEWGRKFAAGPPRDASHHGPIAKQTTEPGAVRGEAKAPPPPSPEKAAVSIPAGPVQSPGSPALGHTTQHVMYRGVSLGNNTKPNEMTKTEKSTLPAVRRSRKQMGTFARVPIEEGMFLPICGELLDPHEGSEISEEDRDCAIVVPSGIFRGHMLVASRKTTAAYVNDCYGCYSEDKRRKIRERNHDRENVAIVAPDKRNGHFLYFKALRRIEPEEELLADYGMEYWAGRGDPGCSNPAKRKHGR